MLFLLSPSKKMSKSKLCHIGTYPPFLDKTDTLINELRKKSSDDLSSLMKISSKLSEINRLRYLNWDNSDKTSAFFLFNGSVYNGIDPSSLDICDLEWSQKHFLILSGLYGIIRPLDLINPYRLEMGINIKIGCKNNLYDFWREDIAMYINSIQKDVTGNVIVNLSSNEYFKVIDTSLINRKIVDCIFQVCINGKWGVVGVNAKRARGLMSRYIIKNKVDSVDVLKNFSADGYSYNLHESTENRLVFRKYL